MFYHFHFCNLHIIHFVICINYCSAERIVNLCWVERAMIKVLLKVDTAFLLSPNQYIEDGRNHLVPLRQCRPCSCQMWRGRSWSSSWSWWTHPSCSQNNHFWKISNKFDYLFFFISAYFDSTKKMPCVCILSGPMHLNKKTFHQQLFNFNALLNFTMHT